MSENNVVNKHKRIYELPDIERLMNQLLLTVEETAIVLRVPQDTVLNLHRCKLLTGILIGRHLRWRPETIRRYVEEIGQKYEA